MGYVFTCSIDDGHPADQRMADLLGHYGLPATFYLPIANCEGPPVMGAAQMREIDRNFEIGSHTHDHCFLSRLSDGDAQHQIRRGKRVLEDTLGHAVDGFCYPGGAYAGRHKVHVRLAGFRYARTTHNLFLSAGPNRYEMATTCQFYPHGRAVYLRNYLRGGGWLARRHGLEQVLRETDWERRLYGLLNAARQRQGVFHLWLHTQDVDQLNAWFQLEAFLAHAAAVTPVAARLTNGALAARFFY